MTVTAIADVHVDNYARWGGPVVAGLNGRARFVLSALSSAVALSLRLHGDRASLVVCGDLFNRSRPEPALLAAVQNIFEQHPRVFILVGNHDQESDAYGHNALAPLAPVAHVVEQPTVVQATGSSRELWLVPFRPGPIAEWLPRVLNDDLERQSMGGAERALFLHAGISDKATPYYLDQTAGSIAVDDLAKLMRAHGIDTCFSGDWHRHQRWRRRGCEIVQVGALCPNRFPPNYEHGHEGPAVTWDGADRIDVHDVPGPRFYKRRWSELDQEWVPTGAPAYLKLTCRTDQVAEAREWLEAMRVRAGLMEEPWLGGIELEIDRGIERAKAKTASFEARQANSLDEALTVYVRAMPVPDGVNRDRVLEHARRLLS